MLSQRTIRFAQSLTYRKFHTSKIRLKKYENPIWRTLRILKNDFQELKEQAEEKKPNAMVPGMFPTHTDIVIIGGGAIGSSIAYWLKQKTGRDGIDVVILEKDPTYSACSTVLSMGELRQQFSLTENIQMSLFGAEFLRTLKKRFGREADVSFSPCGYLVLASEEEAQQLIDNSVLQKELGVTNEILSKNQLKEKFPWMNVTDIELGCLGLEREGWFNPWALQNILKQEAAALGARFIHAEAIDFRFQQKSDIIVAGVQEGIYEGMNDCVIKMPSGEHRTITYAYAIIAAGAETRKIAELARIGTGPGVLSIPLPVEKRKRYLYSFNCKEEPPGINAPMVVDYRGCYFRREGLGGKFLCGMSPTPDDEPSIDNLDVDYNFFEEKIRPNLANRVPSFSNIKVSKSQSAICEYNTYDENGILGPHPYYHNLYLATGFSGHGIQHAPALGRAIAELILDGQFATIDLTRLCFDRIIVNKPTYEVCVYQ